jgi:hypothetical protein
MLTDIMCQDTPHRKKVLANPYNSHYSNSIFISKAMAMASEVGLKEWMKEANETYIRDAGWYFKTLAVQEIGRPYSLFLLSL